MDVVLDEAKELVRFGAVELSIIAQDSNYYGKDRKEKNGLIQLIGKLEKIPALQWIRLMYLYPASIDESLIEVIAESRKVLRYIDMPIQHINTTILKSMRRADTKEYTMRLIEKLWAAMPDVVLRTTIIVGYPGETDRQFAELLDFVKWAQFDALGCFPYFPEIDTPAAKLPNQIPDEIKNQRVDELMGLQQNIIFEKMDTQVGRELTVLVDETYEDYAIGRYYGQAPHIDSICKITNCTAHTGQFVRAKITSRDGYDFLVEQIGIE
jgi:ribosomal protein S12 methylthiotransferase